MVNVGRHPGRSNTPAGPTGRRRSARLTAVVLAAVCTSGFFSTTLLGLGLAIGPEPNSALRAHHGGSPPSVAPRTETGEPAAVEADASMPDAQTRNRRQFPRNAATGQWLFGTGFLLLLLSIGGLITVGIYRRRW